MSSALGVPAAGIDVGGTKILGVALDERGRERGDPVRVTTPPGPELLDAVVAAIGQLTRQGDIGAVGVGLPGLVDRDGRLRLGPNLPGFVDTPFASDLTGRTGLPVVAENDATCAAWAEHQRGAAQGTEHAIVITLGTGIGAGMVVGGELDRGANGFAGEPGHMVVDPHGPPCPCGRRGCWERYASGTGLAYLAGEGSGEEVTAAARAGDAKALDVFQQFAWWIALGVANLVNLLDPEVVVLAGGMMEVADLFLDDVRTSYAELVMGGQYRTVRIVPAELGERAGAIGAALLALSANRRS